MSSNDDRPAAAVTPRDRWTPAGGPVATDGDADCLSGGRMVSSPPVAFPAAERMRVPVVDCSRCTPRRRRGRKNLRGSVGRRRPFTPGRDRFYIFTFPSGDSGDGDDTPDRPPETGVSSPSGGDFRGRCRRRGAVPAMLPMDAGSCANQAIADGRQSGQDSEKIPCGTGRFVRPGRSSAVDGVDVADGCRWGGVRFFRGVAVVRVRIGRRPGEC